MNNNSNHSGREGSGGWGRSNGYNYNRNQNRWPSKNNRNSNQNQFHGQQQGNHLNQNRNYETLNLENQALYASHVPDPNPQHRGFRSGNYYNYNYRSNGGWGRRDNNHNGHNNPNNNNNMGRGPRTQAQIQMMYNQNQGYNHQQNTVFFGYGINDPLNRVGHDYLQNQAPTQFNPFQEALNESLRMSDYLTQQNAPSHNPFCEKGDWSWHEKTFGISTVSERSDDCKDETNRAEVIVTTGESIGISEAKKINSGDGDCKKELKVLIAKKPCTGSSHESNNDCGIFDEEKFSKFISSSLIDMLFRFMKPVMRDANNALARLGKYTPNSKPKMGVDDFDSLSVTDSGVFSDNDGCSSGRSSPVSCKEGGLGAERERFAILTYDQVKRVDSILNEMVALEGRGNFPALELKLKDLLTAVKDRLVKEGIKIRDIRLNGGCASYALKDRLDFCCVCGVVYQPSGKDDGGMICSCISSDGSPKNFSYNDIDLIFGMELSTVKQFDRVKTAVLDALLDLLPPQVCRKRMSACALKEAYVSKMVKVCEGDRWSLIALGNGPAANSSSKGRSCSVELKFVDTMRRQYEFTVDSFQIVLDSLMLFYKCATVPMSSRFYPTVVGESVFGDFYGALYHLQHRLIATRHPEEIRGGGLLKYCNLLVRGYRPADVHSIPPLQRYMCSRFFIDFPEVEQQESKLRTYLANHMSGVSARLRYAFLITLYHVVDSSTVCLMGHERRLTLQLIQRLACELFNPDCGSQGIYGPQPNQMYQCYSTYYVPQPQCTLTTNHSASGTSSYESAHPAPSANGTTYYPTPQISASTSSPAVLSTNSIQHQNHQSQRPPKSCSSSIKTPRHSQQQQQPIQNSSKVSIATATATSVPLLTATS